jgi:hypothetical protein
MQKFDPNNGFQEKKPIFCRKLSKIAENCDHTSTLGIDFLKSEFSAIFKISTSGDLCLFSVKTSGDFLVN